MDKLVSVVVTCYNHEKYIQECLKSIFQQNYSNIELLVYNDGSTDSSGELIENLLKESPFLKTTYIYHDNAGLVETRNRGLKKVSGDYILFVDSDNSIEPNYVRELVTTAHTQNADIVYTNIRNLDTGEMILPAQEFSLERLYVENFVESCSLIRTEIIGDSEYDTYLNYKKLEDYDFFLSLIINRNANAVPCFETHLNYRVLDNSMSARDDIRYYYDVYSYILGKYFTKNPHFGQKALVINFNRQYDLLMNRLEENKVSIYFDRGTGFSEDDKIIRELHLQDDFFIEIESNVQKVRLDLGELPAYFKFIGCYDENNTLIYSEWNNGIQEDNLYLFYKQDPQVIYNMSNYETRGIRFKYEMFKLLNSSHSDFINHMEHQSICDWETHLREKEGYQRQLKELQEELSSVRQQYKQVVGSRRWIIPTKIINFFKRG